MAFALLEGNIASALRQVPAWPLIVNLRADPYERAAAGESEMYLRWMADQMWLYVFIQQKIKAFFSDFLDYPYQSGAILHPSDINYKTLKQVELLKRLKENEDSMHAPQGD
jgi:arylsulfatase